MNTTTLTLTISHEGELPKGLLQALEAKAYDFTMAHGVACGEVVAKEERASTDWRELCRRLYIELFACNQQMTGGVRPKWKAGKVVLDVLAESKAAFESVPMHSDDLAVYEFAKVMREKLSQARAKGRGGWQTCPPEELSRMLREHVEKGDPRDVANFCMFLWGVGSGISKTAESSSASSIRLPVKEMRDE